MTLARVERISVVLPVYNERDNIAPCLNGLWSALQHVEHEILVCYDFDEDTTLEGIRAMGAKLPKSVRLVKNTLGRGPHNALKAGFAAASGDVVVTTMADLSDPPELIPKMAERIRAGAAVVSGSRYMHGGTQKGGPLLKRTLSRIAGVSLAWLGGVGTHDATSNFRAYAKSFLDATTIEATAGFEIALELTVKAHLAGETVDEVASSWVDRTAGESRFRLWKWLPNYLRWYLRALREPALVWLSLGIALWLALWPAGGIDNDVVRISIWLRAGLAVASILCARALRGRNTWIDALLPAVWLAPPALLVNVKATLATWLLRGVIAFAIVSASTGWKRTHKGLRRAFARVDYGVLGIALLVLVFWAPSLYPTVRSAAEELDPSWQQSIGIALRREMGFGSQIVFTYGPLGYFLYSPFDPALFWTKQLLFEIVFKLVVAGFLAAITLRMPGRLERVLFVLAGSVPLMGVDAWAFLGITAVGAWLFLKPERRVGVEWIGVAVLSVFSLCKFTHFLLAALCIAAFGLWCARTRGWHRGLRTPALYAATLLGLWIGLGQNPFDLVRYVLTSLEITRGYSEAMSSGTTWEELVLASCVTLVYVLTFALELSHRPRSKAVWIFGTLLLLTGFLAFKAAFVRCYGSSITFYCYFGVAPLFLSTIAGTWRGVFAWTRVRRDLLGALRCGGVLLALHAHTVGRTQFDDKLVRVFLEWSSCVQQNLVDTLRPRLLRQRVLAETAENTARIQLPSIRETVRQDTVDLVGDAQGIVFANDLNWSPRPVFQSYAAYTGRLAEMNASHLEGPDAPRWVLLNPGTIDRHLPAMDDALVLQTLSRAWQPKLREFGLVLLERRTDAPAPLTGERARAFEADVNWNEWVELPEVDGRCQLLALDIGETAYGKLRQLAFRAPSVWLDIEDSYGRKDEFRIVPSLVRRGVFAQPFLVDAEDWAAWFEGRPPARIVRMRLSIPGGDEAARCFEKSVRVRLERADDLAPPAHPLVGTSRFPMFAKDPDRVSTKFPWSRVSVDQGEALLVHSPSDLDFVVVPGKWRVTARYGILAGAWESKATDGVNFAVVRVDNEGHETPILRRFLNPVAVEADRSTQALDVEVEAVGRTRISLRTRPGPAADTQSDWAWWTDVKLERLGER